MSSQRFDLAARSRESLISLCARRTFKFFFIITYLAVNAESNLLGLGVIRPKDYPAIDLFSIIGLESHLHFFFRHVDAITAQLGHQQARPNHVFLPFNEILV